MTPADGSEPASPDIPPAPPVAAELFGDRLPLAEAYVARLADDGVRRGLIGPREVPRLWDRHVLNCLAVATAVPPGATVADLGSGAGLPGVVLAIGRPDLTVTLVEPLQRRITFLEEVVAELGLEQVRTVRGRAEELHGRDRFDVVTARALAPLSRLLGWAMPLVAASGVLLAMKGGAAGDEIESAATEVRALGCAPPQLITVTGPDGSSTATVVRVAHVDPTRIG